ncbi:hypothetical protein [Pseudomonas soli]|jgi:hypothetical protein|uniref:hypothetical protein n=1 Tax=Pseudomonas soli TaxID=1306993 RepID=UPI0028AEA6A6|nr:hypothetical protein [Pseudomonas soli]
MTESNQGLSEILASEIQVSILENTAGFLRAWTYSGDMLPRSYVGEFSVPAQLIPWVKYLTTLLIEGPTRTPFITIVHDGQNVIRNLFIGQTASVFPSNHSRVPTSALPSEDDITPTD